MPLQESDSPTLHSVRKIFLEYNISWNLEYKNYHFSICTLEILVLCIVSYYSTLLNKYYLIIFVLLKIVKVRIDSEFVEYFILYLAVKLQWTDIFNKFVKDFLWKDNVSR